MYYFIFTFVLTFSGISNTLLKVASSVPKDTLTVLFFPGADLEVQIVLKMHLHDFIATS